MRRKLIAPAALAGVLLVASSAWAPPPAGGGGGRPPVGGGGRPPTGGSGSRPSTGSGGAGARPPIGSPKPAFGKSFEAARAKSATEAAEMLRTQGAFIARSERVAMLSAVTHQLLHQKHAASLADLRGVRADWHAVGPGAGFDPILAMELEAAEAAAERLLLAEILELISNSKIINAEKKIAALGSPRYLPAVVAQTLPQLQFALKRAVAYTKTSLVLEGRPLEPDRVLLLLEIPFDDLPLAVRTALEARRSLLLIEQVFDHSAHHEREQKITAEAVEPGLNNVSKVHGATFASKLRVELSARLFITGQAQEATKLLEGPVDPKYAAVVLADLRTAVLGRGEIATPQVAAFVPLVPPEPPACAVAVLPQEQLTKWQPPARKFGETTVDAAIAEANKQLKVAITSEIHTAAGAINAAADRVRAALAAEAGPLAAFKEKIEAVRGKPLQPAERELAAVAGARGLTVAEAVGVLAADADRPASVGRLLSSVPVCPTAVGLAVVVEVSGRAPAAFADHPDAGFKLTAPPNRTRLRDAVNAVLGSHAGRAAIGANRPALARAELEQQVQKRLNVTEALPPVEVVQALLDVCRDAADDHARLTATVRTLDAALAEIEEEQLDEDTRALRDEFSIAKARRAGLQLDRQKADAVVTVGCQLLGAYGRAAQPTVAWLGEQGEGKPWRPAAKLALAQIAK